MPKSNSRSTTTTTTKYHLGTQDELITKLKEAQQKRDEARKALDELPPVPTSGETTTKYGERTETNPTGSVFASLTPAKEPMSEEQERKAKTAANISDAFGSIAQIVTAAKGGHVPRIDTNGGSAAATAKAIQQIKDTYDKQQLAAAKAMNSAGGYQKEQKNALAVWRAQRQQAVDRYKYAQQGVEDAYRNFRLKDTERKTERSGTSTGSGGSGGSGRGGSGSSSATQTQFFIEQNNGNVKIYNIPKSKQEGLKGMMLRTVQGNRDLQRYMENKGYINENTNGAFVWVGSTSDIMHAILYALRDGKIQRSILHGWVVEE